MIEMASLNLNLASGWLTNVAPQAPSLGMGSGGLLGQGNWLEWILGPDPDRAGSPRLQWANLPESWGVFVLILVLLAIAFAVVWMYRREINTCPMPIKLAMSGLRLAVLLLLIVLFLQPAVYYQQINEVKPTIAVLRDASLSMDRADEYRSRDEVNQLAELTGISADDIANGKVKRWQLINQALAHHPELVERMRDKGALRVVDFDNGWQEVALLGANLRRDTELSDDSKDPDQPQPGDKAIPELSATGLGTDLWQALRQAMEDASRMSAVVLVTEGQHTGSENPVEIAEQAAAQGIPVFVVGVGDPRPPRNLAVREIYVRDKAYPDEPFEVEAILQTTAVGEQGIPPQIDVKLIQQSVDPQSGNLGAPETVKTQSVDVPEQGGRIRVDFDHQMNQPGKYVYTVAVDPLAEESETGDNSKVSSVMEVVDAKIKVLLISGLPSWDYQQVSRLFQRDSTISLSCWLQSLDETRPQEGDAPISRLPTTNAEINEYNVIIMMDPNPEEFDANWVDLLKNFSKTNAGGILFMAGPQFSGEYLTLNRLKEMRTILPVRFGDNASIEETEVLADARDTQPGKMLVVNHNLDHPVMAFRSDPAETQKIWDLMPGIFWNFPALAAKPTARVLLERGDQVGMEGNQPLMVAGRYGAGSVLYMGFQGTYRWRPLGVQAQYFDRFWIQVIRYLVETRSLQGARRGFLDTERTEFELGQRVALVGRVLDEDFEPSTAPTQKVIVRSEDGRTQTVELKRVPNSEGRYEGSFDAQRLGSYEASIEVGGGGLIDPVAFRVVTPSAEAGAYWLNEKLLTEIAEQSGGQYFQLQQIDQLPDALPSLVTRAEFNSPPKPLWDAAQWLRWAAFLLPVLLLTAEWILRKWYKLL